MSNNNSKKPMKNALKTITGWADELNRDRRSLARKLRDVKPDGRAGGFPTYKLATIMDAVKPPPPSASSATKEKKLHEEWRRLKHYNDRKSGEVVEVARVKESITAFNTRVDGVLTRMETEWPALMAGLEAPQIRVWLKKATDDIRSQVSEAYGVWTC